MSPTKTKSVVFRFPKLKFSDGAYQTSEKIAGNKTKGLCWIVKIAQIYKIPCTQKGKNSAETNIIATKPKLRIIRGILAQ